WADNRPPMLDKSQSNSWQSRMLLYIKGKEHGKMQASGVVKPEIKGNVNFEIKSQFMRELREDTFFGNKNKDVHDHVDRVLNIISLFNIPGVSQDAVLLRVFPFTLTGSAKRWVDRLTLGAVNTWDLLKKAFIQRYYPPSKTAKRLEDIHNFKQEIDESLYQAWERYNDLLYKCPTHDINIYQKWHDGTSSRNISSNRNTDGLAIIVGPHLDKECPLNEEVKQVDEVKTLAAKVETKVAQFEECKMIFANYGMPLYTPFYYSPEEIEYFSSNSGFSDDERSETTKVKTLKAIPECKSNLPEQSVNHYVEPYVPLVPFPNRLKQHTEEALVHKTIESLKKIKINRPFLKEIRQTDNYPRYMKDLVANKKLTKDDGEVSVNNKISLIKDDPEVGEDRNESKLFY
ncbi:hypothetical protein Tco_1278611, partial [Tanacetum coccineum]